MAHTDNSESTDTANGRETRQQTASRNVNSVTLVGRLTADPDLRQTRSGVAMTRFRVATNIRGTAEFHSVVAWARLGELVAKQFRKGELIRVDGSLRSRSWKSESGEDRRTVEVVAEQCYTVPRMAAE